MLDKTFFEVVDFWLSIEWANQDDAFATLYQQFLESLISAHAVYGQAVAKMVVKSFGSSEFDPSRTMSPKAPTLLPNPLLLFKLPPVSHIRRTTMVSWKRFGQAASPST